MNHAACVVCFNDVRRLQQGLQCDECHCWQHRTCGSGISQLEYRALQQLDCFQWRCNNCRQPQPQPQHQEQQPHQHQHELQQLHHHQQQQQQQQDVPMESSSDEEIELAQDDLRPELQPQHPADIESSMDEDAPPQVIAHQAVPIVFTLIPRASEKGKDILIRSDGFSYSRQFSRGDRTYWRCTIRNTNTKCAASAVEANGVYTSGKSEHTCQPVGQPSMRREIVRDVRDQARQEIFKPAAEIAEQLMLENEDKLQGLPQLPKLELLAKAGNRARAALRPIEPRDLLFQVHEDALSDNFLRSEVRVEENGRRHFIFASDVQLQLLGRCKEWYGDGTFFVVKEPFLQLYIFHGYVRRNKSIKQIPLVFILMSGKSKRDYRRVLQALKDMLPDCQLISIRLDFEAAMWRAVRSVFPEVKRHGCNFHYSQAIWRQVQSLGLQVAYANNETVRAFCQKLMALPFLPGNRMEAQFLELQQAVENEQLSALCEYIANTWIHSHVWQLDEVSVFNRSIRTNNGPEGYHNRLNQRARSGNLGFYKLAALLFNEARVASLQAKLVSQERLCRYQRRAHQSKEAKIFQYWAEYQAGTKTANQILQAAARYIVAK